MMYNNFTMEKGADYDKSYLETKLVETQESLRMAILELADERAEHADTQQALEETWAALMKAREALEEMTEDRNRYAELAYFFG